MTAPGRPTIAAGLLAVALLAFTVLPACRSEADVSGFRLPAEWEPHAAVWVSIMGQDTDLVVLEIIRAVADHVPVRAVLPRADSEGRPIQGLDYAVRAELEESGVDMSRVSFVRAPGAVQVRDVGPIFVTSGRGEARIVDFGWNAYGRLAGDPAYRDPINFDALAAGQLNLSVIRSRLVMEGGALETNGYGVLLQVESVTLQRNPGWTRDEIEDELKRVLGQDVVIWLKEGPADDPMGVTVITENYLGTGVGGHIDEMARFVDRHTILLAMPDSSEAASDPVKRITRERMLINLKILREARDADGQPFEIIEVPVPDVPYSPLLADPAVLDPEILRMLEVEGGILEGDEIIWVPAASYLNYFVTNRLVLVAEYWQPGLPDRVRQEDLFVRNLLQRFYPDRQIVPLNAILLNNHAGGIHCWTQQEPVRKGV